MKTKKTFVPSWAILALVLFASAFLRPSTAHAQTQYQTTCTSGIVDDNGEVEETVCISGNSSRMDFYVEVDNETPNQSGDVSYLASELHGYDNDTDYTFNYVQNAATMTGGTMGSIINETNFAPNIGDVYTLYGTAGACFDPSYGNAPTNCTYKQLGTLSVQLTTY